MSTKPNLNLPLNLDDALREWPMDLRSAVDESQKPSELFTNSIMKKIAEGPASADSIDAKMLLAPLPEESHNSATPPGLIRTQSDVPPASQKPGDLEARMSAPRRNLKDLAKLASTSSMPPSGLREAAPESRTGEDSGVIDLKATLGTEAPTSARSMPVPAGSTPLSMPPSQPGMPSAPPSARFDASQSMPAPVGSAPMAPGSLPAAPLSMPVPGSAVSAAPASMAPVSSGPASSLAPSAPVSMVSMAPAAASARAPKKGGSGGSALGLILGGGLLTAVAVAAGAFFYMRYQGSLSAVADNSPSGAAAAPIAAASAGVGGPIALAQPAPGPDSDNMGVDPSHPTNGKAGPRLAPRTNPGAGGAAVPAVAPTVAPPPSATTAAKDDPKKPDPSGPAGSLSDEMRKAAGTSSDTNSGGKAEGPQFAPGSVPQKPSQGALTSALGQVMGAARACAADDDTVSRATITFASAGNVQSVSVSGAAAGKPAGECMKAALMRAKVSPFAESSYTTSVTIRH